MGRNKTNEKKRYIDAKNNKAFHDYFIGETFEAGLVLTGTEIKSIREGKAQITDSFIKFIKNTPTLWHAHIAEYTFGNINNHQPLRSRSLLLHKKETQKLQMAVQAGGYTIVPLRLYFKKGLAKLEIAIAKGKKLYDKRQDLKDRAEKRDHARDFKNKMS